MRLELLHPMVVGFPISFLFIGTFLRAGAYFFRKTEMYKTLLYTSWCMISGGIAFGFLAVFTGELATDIVHPTLCKHEVLHMHQRLAYLTLFTFFVAIFLDRARRWSKFYMYPSILLYWIGIGLLLMTGSFGGKLVFEQGAAVKKICGTETQK